MLNLGILIYIYTLSIYYCMSNGLLENTGFGGTNQRKLMIARIENLLKEKLPKNRNDVLAMIMYDTGLTEEKAKDYVRLFFRIGKIDKDNKDERILVWKEN